MTDHVLLKFKELTVTVSVALSTFLSDPLHDSSSLWCAWWINFGFPFCLNLSCTLCQVPQYLLKVISFSTAWAHIPLGWTLPWFVASATVVTFSQGMCPFTWRTSYFVYHWCVLNSLSWVVNDKCSCRCEYHKSNSSNTLNFLADKNCLQMGTELTSVVFWMSALTI